MSQEVNKEVADATSTETELRVVEDDALELMMKGFNNSTDTDQPTLNTVVEEEQTTEDDQTVPPDEYILVDEDGNEVEEEEGVEYVYVDESDDPVAEGDEVTNQDDPEVIEDTPEFDPNDKNTWAYIGHASEYKTVEDWKIGTERKDTYIEQLVQANDEKDEELTQLTEQLSLYTSTVTPEMLEAAMVQQLLPEEFRGKGDDDFEDDKDLRAFWKAQAEAKLRYEQQQREAKAEAEKAEKDRQASIKSATQFVRDTATTGFFDVTNPEERAELRTKLTTKDDSGFTTIDHARYITQVFGESAGRRYLEGLRLEIHGGSESSGKSVETKSHKESVPTKPKRKVVQKVKKKKVKVKTQITPPPPGSPSADPMEGKDAIEMMTAGFKPVNR